MITDWASGTHVPLSTQDKASGATFSGGADSSISPPPHYDVETVQRTGPDSNRIDIVFLGDGYTAGEIDGAYADHVQALVSYLLTGGLLSDPFGRYANFFNIYQVDVISNQSGADDPESGIVVDTALNASYKWDGVTDRLLYIDEGLAYAALNGALAGTDIHADIRFVTVNATKYGGGGGNFGVYAGGNSSALEIALHEIGHSFAGLADQYDSGGPTTYTGPEPSQPDVTKDSSGAKWAEWLGYDQPGIGVIGAYEGAYYSQHGVYRPSLDSKMRSLGQPFDAIGREQFILNFYALVDPLDAYTDNTVALVDPNGLLADTIDPAVISTRWIVDGNVVSDSNLESFVFEDFNIPSGTHAVEVLAYDPTDWVRGDRSSLEQHVAWDITLVHAVLRATHANHVLVGGPLIDKMYGTGTADSLTGGAGRDTLKGKNGNDELNGGDGKDKLYGAEGADRLSGAGSTDIFIYAAVSESNKTAYDTMVQFNSAVDKIDLWFAVTAVDATVSAQNIGKIAQALDADHLQSNHAALVNIGSKTFLVVDANGVAGYQANQDLLVRMDHVTSIDTANFI